MRWLNLLLAFFGLRKKEKKQRPDSNIYPMW
jgi:hypothetical protein